MGQGLARGSVGLLSVSWVQSLARGSVGLLSVAWFKVWLEVQLTC